MQLRGTRRPTLPAKRAGRGAHVWLLCLPMPGELRFKRPGPNAEGWDAIGVGIHIHQHQKALIEFSIIARPCAAALARAGELDFFVIDFIDPAEAHEKILEFITSAADILAAFYREVPHPATYQLVALGKCPTCARTEIKAKVAVGVPSSVRAGASWHTEALSKLFIALWQGR